MKENEFLDGISNMESDVVERFISMDNTLQKKASKTKSKTIYLRFGVIAACLVLIVGMVIVFPISKVPTWDTAQYSAKEIANLFSSMKYNDVATNAYTKVYVPDDKYLYIDGIADEEYLNVYQYRGKEKLLNENEFHVFVESFLPKLADSLNAEIPQYNIQKNHDGIENSLSVDTDLGAYYTSILQSKTSYGVLLRKLKGDEQIVIDGETIQIDQRISDEEILDSIQSIKNKLFEIFNVSFSDAKVVRRFGSYTEYGAEFVEIYFYDESAHPLNSMLNIPESDYICISFDNFLNHSEDIVSNSILNVSVINYFKRRINIDDVYDLKAKAKRISISEAENLLYNGYVFGGHSCPLCMAAQDKVSFKDYDFVDMEYVFGYDYKTGKLTKGIPFYAFYKKIGIAQNGNTIYAKTYVAAIEVKGYEEYFKNQEKEHRNTIHQTYTAISYK